MHIPSSARNVIAATPLRHRRCLVICCHIAGLLGGSVAPRVASHELGRCHRWRGSRHARRAHAARVDGCRAAACGQRRHHPCRSGRYAAGVCRAALPVGFFVPAWGLQCRAAVCACAPLRLQRIGHHRRMLIGRHRAWPGSFARHRRVSDCWQRVHPGRWHALRAAGGERARLSAAVQCDHHRPACGRQGRVPVGACRGGSALSRCGSGRLCTVAAW